MGAARKSNTSPEGHEANRLPVRYGAPAAAVLRAQTAAPSHSSASVASVRSAMQPGERSRRASKEARLGRRGMRLASVQEKAQRCLGGVTPEPSDREVSRSARRLSILGARGGSSHARRLPGSARPKVDGARPDDAPVTLASMVGVTVAVVVAFLLALVIYCA